MQPSKEQLELTGKLNLQWIESQQFYVLGINVFQSLAYELIQMLNNNSLKVLLDGNAESKE